MIHTGMSKDTWIHTDTRTEYGTNGVLGSPRAWLRRALDAPTLDDTAFLPGSLTPTEISVAGVWYKTDSGFALPSTGTHRELFRIFPIPEPDRILQRSLRAANQRPLVPAIGLASAVPITEMLHWVQVYKQAGAAYTWWNPPVNRAQRAGNPLAGKRPRRQLDHAEVYALLDGGKNRIEISKHMNFPPENIDYVIRKWRAGIPLYEKFQKPRIDAPALVQDYKAGASPRELADKYTTALAYVYKLISQQKEPQCQDPSLQ